MDSDVEMLEQDQKSLPALVTSIPPPPPDSQQASPIAPDFNDSASIGPDEPSAADVAPKPSSDVKVKGKPASGKPKSSKARARSPSPTPPPAQAPLETIRLDITLGGPDNYEVDVSALAKATGQRLATPLPAVVKQYENESDSDGEGGAPESGMRTDDGDGEKKGRKVREKKKRVYASVRAYTKCEFHLIMFCVN
jgi:hypothetical protein